MMYTYQIIIDPPWMHTFTYRSNETVHEYVHDSWIKNIKVELLTSYLVTFDWGCRKNLLTAKKDDGPALEQEEKRRKTCTRERRLLRFLEKEKSQFP